MTTPDRRTVLAVQIRSAQNTLIAAREIEHQVDTYTAEELRRAVEKIHEACDQLDAALVLGSERAQMNARLKR